jgi:AcrR family transcriptional regulator
MEASYATTAAARSADATRTATRRAASRAAGGRPRRMTAAERRKQIVQVTMELVARNGVQATTTSRIAAGCGISEATLYRHFAGRKDMLLAAMDLVYERVFKVIHTAESESALDRLRAIGRYHAGIIADDAEGFVYPLFEFVAAPPDCGLREPLAQRQRLAIDGLAAILEEGKVQGRVRPDIDSAQIAWELVAVYWAQDVSYLMGLNEYVNVTRGEQMLERILASIAAA